MRCVALRVVDVDPVRLLTGWLVVAVVLLAGHAGAARAAAPVDATDRWAPADAIAAAMDDDWRHSERGNYYKDGGEIRVRGNAMALQIHARAAEAGHAGAARRDERVNLLADTLCKAPVLIYRTRTRRTHGSFPHTPAFGTDFRRTTSEDVALHPSADSAVAVALAAAYRVRDVVQMPEATREQVRRAIAAVARGPFYRGGRYAENQVNWNADVAMADWEVNRYRPALLRYRDCLVWLARYAHRRIPGGRLPAFSSGYGFHYAPSGDYGFNAVDSVEYANLVHASLGYYRAARAAGMPRLGPTTLARLRAWDDHVLYGTWTHAGYLNWDAALGSKRRHLAQYWTYALWGLARSASFMDAGRRQVVGGLLTQATALYGRELWDFRGQPPHEPTLFGAPNSFPKATREASTPGLRLALALIADPSLPASRRALFARPHYGSDREQRRVAVSTRAYNAAIVGATRGRVGGLDLLRLADAQQRPVMPLGTGDAAGASSGMRLERGGAVMLSLQSGRPDGRTRGPDAGGRSNRSGTFEVLKVRGSAATRGARIGVEHTFRERSITSRYRVSQSAPSRVLVVTPLAGRATCTVTGATRTRAGRWRRTDGALQARCTAGTGASVRIRLYGIPRGAPVWLERRPSNGWKPGGATELRTRLTAQNAAVTRVIEP